MDNTHVIFSENCDFLFLEHWLFNGGPKTAGGPWLASSSNVYNESFKRAGHGGRMRPRQDGVMGRGEIALLEGAAILALGDYYQEVIEAGNLDFLKCKIFIFNLATKLKKKI